MPKTLPQAAPPGPPTAAGLEIIYDGQCPFCSAYTRMVRLQQAAGPVHLIDARSGDPRVGQALAAGFDLDAGLIVRHGGQVFHGDAAIRHLSVLSAPGGVVNGAMRAVFRNPRRAALLYPWLARGRALTLALMGRRRIGSPRQKFGQGAE